MGPPASGARFTPKGGATALYLAEDQTTALREFLQVGLPAGLTPTASVGALVIFNVEVNLASVLDLTRSDVQKVLATDAAELASPWRYWRRRGMPPTHRLGAAVARSGRFDAIRFRSSKGAGACLAIFTGLLRPPAYVRIRDPDNRLVQELP